MSIDTLAKQARLEYEEGVKSGKIPLNIVSDFGFLKENIQGILLFNYPSTWDENTIHFGFDVEGYNDTNIDIFYNIPTETYTMKIKSEGEWASERRGKSRYARKWTKKAKKAKSLLEFINHVVYCEM